MIKVLYLEDEVFLGQIVQESLSSRSYEIVLVTDGAAFMETFESFQPDICVLDIMVPNKDGYTLATEIKAQHPSVPIIFVSAKNQTEDVIKGFKSGGNDYLPKPFSMEELIVRIENLIALTGKQKALKSSYILGSYRFDAVAMKLYHSDETVVQLSHRENELLQLFAQAKNQQIDRREILEKLWGDDSIYHSRNLDVYIRKLRIYLSKDASIQLKTLRGVGYRFILPE